MLVVLCSAAGSPGVTVSALGLALTWPRDVLLVDADRTPSQAIQAGYLRGASAHDLGLAGVLQAHRERRPLAEALPAVTLALPEPAGRRGSPRERAVVRRFLPGFAHPGSVEVFAGVWRQLAAALAGSPFDVIVDAGRIGTRGLPGDLVDAASELAVVCRSSLVSLAALRLYLGVLAEQAPSTQLGLLLVGPGRPYRAREVAEQFGVPVLAEVAWEPRAASDLQEGQPLPTRWRQQRLAASFAEASGRLTRLHDAERLRIGVAAR